MIEKNYAPLKGVTRAVLAIAMAGSCAFAQTEEAKAAPSEETELPAMTVSANAGAAVALENVGVSVTVLNVEDLKEEGVYTVSNALTEVPGVFVLPGGGLNQTGNVSNIAIRGMSSDNYILTSMDGMRLNSPSTNTTSNVLGRTNLFNIGTLEVLRGSEAAVYGGGAIGGVLFMETPEGQGEPSYELFNEVGSFDTYTGSMTAQGQVDKLSYFVNITYARTGNDFEMVNGEKYSTPHAGKSENWQESIRLDYQLNEDNKTTLTYRREDADFVYPSQYDDWDGSIVAETQDYGLMSNLITLKHVSKISDKYTSDLMAGFYGSDSDFLGDMTTHFESRNVQIEWNNHYEWNKQNKTKAGFAWNRTQYKAANEDYDSFGWVTPAGEQTSLENIYAVYADHSYKPAENWDNNVALRLDSSSQFGELFTFRAASNYKLNQDTTRLFASVGSGYKAPSQFQLSEIPQTYWGTTYYGNSDLKEETSISFDFGIEQKIAENHKVSATYFWIQTQDKITDCYGYDYDTWTSYCNFENAAGHALSQGIELSATGLITEVMDTRYTLSYTYTQPKMSDGTQIEQTARQTWSADINCKPCENLLIGAGLTAACGVVDSDSDKLDNYYTMRLYAKYNVNENVSLHLRLENITNQKFVIESHYSNPDYSLINSGAAIYGGCTIKF